LKRTLSILLLIACATAAVVVLYRTAGTPHPQGSSSLHGIPPDAALILETHRLADLWHDLSQYSHIWGDLQRGDVFFRIQVIAQALDSAMRSTPQLRRALEGRAAAISIHGRAEGPAYLAVLATDSDLDPDEVRKLVDGLLRTASTPLDRRGAVPLYRIQPRFADAPVYAWFQKGALALSLHEGLLRESADAFAAASGVQSQARFAQVRRTRGLDALAQVYVQPATWGDLLSKYIDVAPAYLIPQVPAMDWLALDVSIRTDAITLRGFGAALQPVEQYMDALPFLGLTLAEYMPSHTAAFTWEAVQPAQLRSQHLGAAQSLRAACSCSADSLLYNWIGGQLARFSAAGQAGEVTHFGLIHTGDPLGAWAAMNELSFRLSGAPPETASVGAQEAIHLPEGVNLEALWGAAFRQMGTPWITPLSDALLIAPTRESLENVLRMVQTGKTLVESYYWEELQQQITTKARVVQYTSPTRAAGWYGTQIKETYREQYSAQSHLLANLHGALLEWSPYNDTLHFVNIYLGRSEAPVQVLETVWECELLSKVVKGPFAVRNHYTGATELVLQDDSNRVYLLSETGKVLWHIQTNGPMLSEVHQVDALRNGKLQMLFNTAAELYLVDRNGNAMDGYPIPLPAPATNGVQVADYEGTRDYRFMLAMQGGRLRMYDAKGKAVSGFDFTDSEANVVHPMCHIRIRSKDYIMAVNAQGRIHLLDRQGKPRHEVGLPAMGMGPGRWYFQPGDSHIAASALCYADTVGAVYRLRFDGRFDRATLPAPHPMYSVWLAPESEPMPWCVSAWGDGLVATDLNGNTKWKYPLELSEPNLAWVHTQGGQLLLALADGGKVHLLHADGRPWPGSPFYGATLPVVGDLTKMGRNLLVTALGNRVYCYALD
jgi:hypothetical protein